MDLPHGRVLQRHAFDQHILAAIWLDKLRTQVMPLSKNSFADRRALLGHLQQKSTVCGLVWIAWVPSAFGPAFPRPPVFTVSISVNGSFAGDSNIFFFKRIDEWRIVHQFNAFPPGKHQWVFARVTREADGCSGANMEIHVALQADRTRNEFAGGNNNPA